MEEKLSWRVSFLGMLLPIIGIFVSKKMKPNNGIYARSFRRGSAISTLVFFFFALALLFYVAFFQSF